MRKKRYPLSDIALFHAGLPVYLLSSLSSQGNPNIAPFCMTMLVAYTPPLLLTCFEKHTDSLRNVKSMREFVLNLSPPSLLEAIDICAEPFPKEINEFEKAHLTPLKSLKVAPPSIKECSAHIECRARSFVKLPSKQTLCVADVVALRGDERWAHRSLRRQKQMLNPLLAFQPKEGKVPFFAMGKFVGEI